METQLQRQGPQETRTGRPNLTGIPAQMKLDLERRSGLSFDDVRVHYNSDRPAQLQALAYTQGTQVYIGPGQERSLPHELGHVIQQMTSPVSATGFVNGFAVNDDPVLEAQADALAYAAVARPVQRRRINGGIKGVAQRNKTGNAALGPLARPNFTYFIQKTMPVGKGQDRRHIIPAYTLISTLSNILRSELDADVPPSSLASEIYQFLFGSPSIPAGGPNLQQLAELLISKLNSNEHNLIVDTSKENRALGTLMKKIEDCLSLGKDAIYDRYIYFFKTLPPGQKCGFLEIFKNIVCDTHAPIFVEEYTVLTFDAHGNPVQEKTTFPDHVWGSDLTIGDFDKWYSGLEECRDNVSVDIMTSRLDDASWAKLNYMLGGTTHFDFFTRFREAKTLKSYLAVSEDFLKGPR